MIGIPSPPFLMMAPSGAPMKKNIRHESARVNFDILSISCWRISLSPSDVTIALNSRSVTICLTSELALLSASLLSSAFSFTNAVSTLYDSFLARPADLDFSFFDSTGEGYLNDFASL